MNYELPNQNVHLKVINILKLLKGFMVPINIRSTRIQYYTRKNQLMSTLITLDKIRLFPGKIFSEMVHVTRRILGY